MSRFSNLEFEDDAGPRTGSGQEHAEEGIRDEAHHLAAAARAYENADFEAGLRHYARALEDNPRSLTAWTGQVRMLIELQEHREARAWADKALEQLPDQPDLLAAKAVALARLGDLDEAMALSDAAFEERGSSVYLWLARADVLLARGEARAAYCIDKALSLAPRDWFTAWIAARIELAYERFAAGLKLLQQSIAWDAGRFAVWCDLGECQASLGCLAAARDSYRQSLDLNPDFRAAHAGLNRLNDVGALGRLLGFWHRLKGS